MVQSFKFSTKQVEDIIIIYLSGYLENVGGKQLKEYVQNALCSGITKFVFSFKDLSLISSPGVAAILDLASEIVDDYAGKLVVYNINDHQNAVLEMAGFFFMANLASSEEEAINLIKREV